ncbi:hypothetical protein IP92_02778 [Pseudoduganella flava]|uniref:Integrase n=1 Tax=Pseudoduganella flava TaxID=871742 RepID=A0A562PTE1_9BURK|nr:hypothetical protein [Pseudoduganella flava]QGZ39018.1 hypothetical protein GO485_08115 [Pseudoduganella flava]TWI47717.1 hypothetical protein IP92_02778 [Pseudoduganella flava]
MDVTVFRPRKGNIWHYRSVVIGERVQGSTRLTKRGEAEEFAGRVYSDAVIRASRGEPVPTLAELFNRQLAMHAQTASADHLRSVSVVRLLHLYWRAPKARPLCAC